MDDKDSRNLGENKQEDEEKRYVSEKLSYNSDDIEDRKQARPIDIFHFENQAEMQRRKELRKIYLRKKITLILSIFTLLLCVTVSFSIQLVVDDSFYKTIIKIVSDKFTQLATAVSSFIAAIISALIISFLNSENKKEKELQKPNEKSFSPPVKDKDLFLCMGYVLKKISEYKKTNEDKRKELSDTGRSYLLWGVAIQFLCIIIFQFFSYISPEKELFKIYGMVSCAVIFMIIVTVGIWHLNQAHNYSKNLSKIMNAELCITKCLLICNLDIEKKEKYELLRIELLNAEIKNDAKDTASAGIPYKMAFDIFKDMIKKNQ